LKKSGRNIWLNQERMIFIWQKTCLI
jgi:hypothetical protein